MGGALRSTYCEAMWDGMKRQDHTQLRCWHSLGPVCTARSALCGLQTVTPGRLSAACAGPGDGPLFDRRLTLHRSHTALAPLAHVEAGGKEWDTVKPLREWRGLQPAAGAALVLLFCLPADACRCGEVPSWTGWVLISSPSRSARSLGSAWLPAGACQPDLSPPPSGASGCAGPYFQKLHRVILVDDDRWAGWLVGGWLPAACACSCHLCQQRCWSVPAARAAHDDLSRLG